MKTLQIPQINVNDSSSLKEITGQLREEGAKGLIDQVNWPGAFPHKPETSYRMGYTKDAILLSFQVHEDAIRAVETQPNGNVWEDSCCEFFCAFDDTGYYNIETNCIGTQLLGWSGITDKQRASADRINNILKFSTLGDQPLEPQEGDFTYQLTMKIPVSSFFKHQIKLEKGMTFRANFYKCGDKTPKPHFVSWNPIETPHPDFHRPEFFGTVELV